MAIFGQKRWVNPYGKISILRSFQKMAIFGQEPCVNPVGKMSIFRLFELFVFIA